MNEAGVNRSGREAEPEGRVNISGTEAGSEGRVNISGTEAESEGRVNISGTEAEPEAAVSESKWGPGAASPGVWLRAARPFTLPAAVVPILVGSALAFRNGQANLLHFVLALLGSLLVQAGVNFVDEYSDHDRAASAHKHVAPYKVLARGELTPRAVRLGAVVVFGVATLIGIYFVVAAGWVLLAVCLASLAAAYFYAGGPNPLGHYGLGVPLVFAFMGVVMVMASYFIHTESWSVAAFIASIPVACLVTAILVANDIRDLEEDRAEGKATAVTVWGRGFGRWLWVTLALGAYAVVIVWSLTTPRSRPLLLVILSLPQFVFAARTLWAGQDRASLALGLRQTAGLHLSFGVLFAIGLCLRI